MQGYDLNLVVALVALLETGSVTRAAQRLHLSVPATSRVLGRLREVFADPLLVRAGARLVVTSRGLTLLQPARDALAAVLALPGIGAPLDLSVVRHGFTVRLPDPMSVVLAAPLSAALAKVMPQVTLALVSDENDMADALREGRLDIALSAIVPVLPELRSEPLPEQSLVGVVRVGHPLTRGRATAARIAAVARVAVQPTRGRTDPLDDALGRLGLRSRAVLSVPSPYAALTVAATSDLLACVPARIAGAVAGSLRLRVIDLPFDVPAERLAVCWHRRTETSPAHAWLRDRLRAMIERPMRRTNMPAQSL